jgi:uncharacterized membrane protein
MPIAQPVARPAVGRNLASIAQQILWASGALLCVAVALFSFRYLLDAGPVIDLIAANAYRAPWLEVHVACAAAALAIGPFQFLRTVRRRWPRAHRVLGRTYVAGCLGGALSGLALALGSAAGPVATAGFGLLALVWLATTACAWRAAQRRAFDAHRAFMLRSFALTAAAVTLRIYVGALPLLDIAFVDAYRAISFLSWVPNLIVVELYLRARR